MGVYAIFYSLNSFNETFLLSQGKANWLLKINIVDKIVLVILFITALRFGLIYFAYAKLVVTVIAFIVKFIMAGLIHRVSFWFWLKSLDKILAALVLSIATGLLCQYFLLSEHILSKLFIVTSSSLMVFALTLHVLRDDSFNEISNILRTYLKK